MESPPPPCIREESRPCAPPRAAAAAAEGAATEPAVTDASLPPSDAAVLPVAQEAFAAIRQGPRCSVHHREVEQAVHRPAATLARWRRVCPPTSCAALLPLLLLLLLDPLSRSPPSSLAAGGRSDAVWGEDSHVGPCRIFGHQIGAERFYKTASIHPMPGSSRFLVPQSPAEDLVERYRVLHEAVGV